MTIIDSCVFRARTEIPRTVLTEHQAAYQLWNDQVDAGLATIWAGDDGPHTKNVMTSTSAFGPRHELVGLVRPSDRSKIPAGWREDARSGALVPRMSTTAGKLAAAWLGRTQPPPDPRTTMPGMPPFLMVMPAIKTWAAEDLDGSIYAVWYLPLDKVLPEVDTELWEQVALSRYLALKESLDAAAVMDAAAIDTVPEVQP